MISNLNVHSGLGGVQILQMPQPRPLISTFGWDIKSIIDSSPNFHPVQRVHYTSPNAKVEIVIPEVERDGNPLIINGWNRHPRWPKSLFNIDWLRKNGDQSESCSPLRSFSDSCIKTQPSGMYTTGLISRSLWTTSSKNCAKHHHMQAQMVSLYSRSPCGEQNTYFSSRTRTTLWKRWRLSRSMDKVACTVRCYTRRAFILWLKRFPQVSS
jgi:hypothetical protein